MLLACTERALLHRLAIGQVDGRAPSMVGAVVRDGERVWFGARGRVGDDEPGADTAYRIGSLTKTFTAVLVMRLRDEGRLDLDDPVLRHLPGTGMGELTIAQLLAHTAGVGAEPPGPWWERTPGELRPELTDVLAGGLRHPPGRRFHYSNPGFALLGALVARLRGRPWADVLRTEILGPLKMTNTGVAPTGAAAPGLAVHPWADALLPEPTHDYGPMAPAGQLWSTAADLCRWAAFLAAGDGRVLSADSVAQMRAAAGPAEDPDGGLGYGFGLELITRGGRTLAGHHGSVPGFLAALFVDPEQRLGALALTNATAGPAIGEIVLDLLGTVTEREPAIPPAWRPADAIGPALLELAGPWYWGPLPLAVRAHEGRELTVGPLDGAASRRASRMRPEVDGTWTGVDGYHAGETLRVVRDDDGAISHLDLGTFVLTRAPYDPAAAVPGGVDGDGWRGASSQAPTSPAATSQGAQDEAKGARS